MMMTRFGIVASTTETHTLGQKAGHVLCDPWCVHATVQVEH